MKCTNCGKNNAMYHYRFEMNGETREAHLCAECARELQPEREFAARSREMFGELFGGFFDERPARGMLDGFFGRDPFEGFFADSPLNPFAVLGSPKIEISFPGSGNGVSGETAGRAGVDPELARQRQVNALREQMRAAAQEEDYERAAKLRDELRALENKDGA